MLRSILENQLIVISKIAAHIVVVVAVVVTHNYGYTSNQWHMGSTEEQVVDPCLGDVPNWAR